MTLFTLGVNRGSRLLKASLLLATSGSLTFFIWHRRQHRGKPSISSTELRSAYGFSAPPRSFMMARLQAASDPSEPFDVLVIGGGAVGAGCALDAASRGDLSVACVEARDWASGTSSKSTKLVHGGVRYLEKAIKERDWGQWALVKEALRERDTLLRIAPHLTHPLPIMLPVYQLWKVPYYWMGAKMYDWLAGSRGLYSSYMLSKAEALRTFPLLKSEHLAGAVVYFDGQMNDARLNLSLALTAIEQGAIAANYVQAEQLIKDDQGRVKGAIVRDMLTGTSFPVHAKVVINATGAWTDQLRQQDDPSVTSLIIPSTGAHIVLPGHFSPEGNRMGLIDPHTSDGRVIFFLPWEGNTLAGTTDSPATLDKEPRASSTEIDFILKEVQGYLSPDSLSIRKEDVISAWAGLRPLVRDPSKIGDSTEALVRSHLVEVSKSGLLTIAGGKWTTYRQMAEDTVDRAIQEAGLRPRSHSSQTRNIILVGAHTLDNPSITHIKLIRLFGLDSKTAWHLIHHYGDRALDVAAMSEPTSKSIPWPLHGVKLLPSYPHIEAEVRWACRQEYAVNAIDLLARRLNLSFLNVHATAAIVPRVIELMAEELSWTPEQCAKERASIHEHLLSMGLDTLEPSRALFSRTQIAHLKHQFIEKCSNHGRQEDNPMRVTWAELAELLPNAKIYESLIKEKIDPHGIGLYSMADYLQVLIIIQDLQRKTMSN